MENDYKNFLENLNREFKRLCEKAGKIKNNQERSPKQTHRIDCFLLILNYLNAIFILLNSNDFSILMLSPLCCLLRSTIDLLADLRNLQLYGEKYVQDLEYTMHIEHLKLHEDKKYLSEIEYKNLELESQKLKANGAKKITTKNRYHTEPESNSYFGDLHERYQYLCAYSHNDFTVMLNYAHKDENEKRKISPILKNILEPILTELGSCL